MKTKRDSSTLVDRVVIQHVYDHGGSRIYTETNGKAERKLIADSFTDELFADELFEFVQQWLASHGD